MLIYKYSVTRVNAGGTHVLGEHELKQRSMFENIAVARLFSAIFFRR